MAPTPPLIDPTDPNQQSRASLTVPAVTVDEPHVDFNGMIEQILHQYPHMSHEQIRAMFAEVAQTYQSEHALHESERPLITKFQNLA